PSQPPLPCQWRFGRCTGELREWWRHAFHQGGSSVHSASATCIISCRTAAPGLRLCRLWTALVATQASFPAPAVVAMTESDTCCCTSALRERWSGLAVRTFSILLRRPD